MSADAEWNKAWVSKGLAPYIFATSNHDGYYEQPSSDDPEDWTAEAIMKAVKYVV